MISAKVSTPDGQWWALDARYLKRKQRMIGGIYQLVLRAELAYRFGLGWEPVVNGQAEIAGTPPELLEVFSKRAGEVEAALEVKVDEFRARQGRDPTRWEHAALTREAAVDTRAHKSGNGVADLQSRWLEEAAHVGWETLALIDQLTAGGRAESGRRQPTVDEVVDVLSAGGSTWTRAEVMRIICDLVPPVSQMSGHRWAQALERACDKVLEHGIGHATRPLSNADWQDAALESAVGAQAGVVVIVDAPRRLTFAWGTDRLTFELTPEWRWHDVLVGPRVRRPLRRSELRDRLGAMPDRFAKRARR